MKQLLIQVGCVLFAGGLTAQELPEPYISSEALESDLQTLYQWIQELHPRHEVLDSASFVAFSSRFPSGAPTFFVSAAIDEALRPLEDEHTSVNIGMWTSLVAEAHGVWDGHVEVLNETGDLKWLDGSGLEVDSLYARSAPSLSPAALFQGVWPELHPATRADQVAAIAPMWAPFLAAAKGTPMNKMASPKNVQWKWDKADRTFLIESLTFLQSTDQEFESQIIELEAAMKSAANEGIDLWTIDLRGNGGGEYTRAMMLAELFTDESVRFHHSVHILGSQALRDWGRNQVPWWQRPFASPYDRAILKTAPGELSSLPAFEFPASDGVVPADAQVQVLVNGLTGSAAAALAWWLKIKRHASLVGIPPYAQIHAVCGNTLTAILPESGIPVRMSTTCWTDSPSLFPSRVAMSVDSMVFAEQRLVERLQVEHPRDHAFLQGLMAAMKGSLPDSQKFQMLAAPIVWACAERVSELNEEQRQLEQLPGGATTESGLAPAEAMNELLRLKKEAVEQRNAELRLLVPMHLWPAMNAWLNPEKPAVLHFGLHDRMNCNVCKPE